MNLDSLLNYLRAGSLPVRHVVQRMSGSDWSRATPATGWSVAHRIGHLAWTDAMPSIAVPHGAGHSGRRCRSERLHDSLGRVDPQTRILWFGPPMKPTSMATARLMQTWGPADAEQRVTGSAWDFARVAVRRVHPVYTELLTTGDDARVSGWASSRHSPGHPGPTRWRWGSPMERAAHD